jgi:hypothetical protein
MLNNSGDMKTLKPLYYRQFLPGLTDELRPDWTILLHPIHSDHAASIRRVRFPGVSPRLRFHGSMSPRGTKRKWFRPVTVMPAIEGTADMDLGRPELGEKGRP